MARNLEPAETSDANGNDLSAGSYDVLNRLIAAGGAEYGYAPDNKRIWKKKPDGSLRVTWGGRFRRADPPHFQLPPSGTKPDPKMVEDCEK